MVDLTIERESVDSFYERARAWIVGHLPRSDRSVGFEVDDEAERVLIQEARQVQRKIFDAEFAGIRYPPEYGGLGLTREHQLAWARAATGFRLPSLFNVTHGIIGPTILEFGTEVQKRRFLPAMLRGEELWVQLLSEPSGGSDLAGLLTRASRDGDAYVVNGCKTWSTRAQFSDFAMALVRTDLDAPKHRGLSMIVFPMSSAGMTVRPIKLSTGASHFCEEFLDDVVVPSANLIGEENDGWRVASGLLYHERAMVGGNSLNDHLLTSSAPESVEDELVSLAKRLGTHSDPVVRQLIGEALVLRGLSEPTIQRINSLMQVGQLPPQASAILKLLGSTVQLRLSEIAMEIGGVRAAAADDDEISTYGLRWLGARTTTIAGGSNEIQRNQISERILGLPPEPSPDKGIPFRQVLADRRTNQS
jgi:alkylation response protein AidB-like acyl-CoA dehydrogenase